MPNLTFSAAQHASASSYKQPQTELFLLKHCLFLLSPFLSLCIYSIIFHNLWTYLFPVFYCATFLNKVLNFYKMWFTTIANNHLNGQIPHLIYLNTALHPFIKIVRNAAAKLTLFLPYLYFLYTFQFTFSLGKNISSYSVLSPCSLSHLPNMYLYPLSFQSDVLCIVIQGRQLANLPVYIYCCIAPI